MAQLLLVKYAPSKGFHVETYDITKETPKSYGLALSLEFGDYRNVQKSKLMVYDSMMIPTWASGHAWCLPEHLEQAKRVIAEKIQYNISREIQKLLVRYNDFIESASGEVSMAGVSSVLDNLKSSTQQLEDIMLKAYKG